MDSCNVLICGTGSVAAIKIPVIVEKLKLLGSVNVKLCLTERARHFCTDKALQEIPIELHTDEKEWKMWNGRGDPVLHIELAKWANILLIAPLDANTLGKIASGICDNLVTCVIRAWNPKKRLIFCPAMNTQMWNHPVTAEHIDKLKSWGYEEIQPIAKTLMCGDTGIGAMAEPMDIVDRVNCHVKLHFNCVK